MNRWILGLTLAATLAALVVLILEARPRSTAAMMASSDTPAPTTDQPPPSPRPTAAHAARRAQPSARADERGEPEAPAAEALPTPPTSHATEVLLHGEIPERIYQAAAPCYEGEPGRSEKMEIDYTLVVVAGEVRLEGVELVSSEVDTPRLERCVVQTISELRWSDQSLGDMQKDMQAHVSILGLQKRQPRDPDDDRHNVDDAEDDPGLVNRARAER